MFGFIKVIRISHCPDRAANEVHSKMSLTEDELKFRAQPLTNTDLEIKQGKFMFCLIINNWHYLFPLAVNISVYDFVIFWKETLKKPEWRSNCLPHCQELERMNSRMLGSEEIKFCFARQVNGKQLLLNKECRLFKNNWLK